MTDTIVHQLTGTAEHLGGEVGRKIIRDCARQMVKTEGHPHDAIVYLTEIALHLFTTLEEIAGPERTATFADGLASVARRDLSTQDKAH